MKKNLFRKYSGCFFYGLLFLLTVSCRNEALFTEDAKVKTEIIAKQMKFDELQTIPNLANKIASYKNDVNRVYADSIHHFTVDTDYGLYLEDANHNKTYTFKIERTPPSPIFENLVLKDLGNGVFDAYIAKYDSILLGNHENIPANQVKNYFGLAYIGTKNTTDVFGKLSTCSFTITSEIFVPGTCSSDQHHSAGDPNANCQCGTPGYLDCTPASEGYYTTVYNTYYLSCDDGGSVSGTTGTYTPTSPYPSGGGSGGNIDLNPPQTNCETIQQASEEQKVKDAIDSLKTKTTGRQEFAYEIQRKYDNAVGGYVFTTNPKIGTEFGTMVATGGYIKGQAHNHPSIGQSIPSIGDVIWLKLCKDNIAPTSANAYNLVVCYDPGNPTDTSSDIVYSIMIDDFSSLQTKVNELWNRADLQGLTNEDKYKVLNGEMSDMFKDVQFNTTDMEKKFIETYNNFGISLYKQDKVTKNWDKLSINNNIVTKTPCL